ncbi:MAG: HAMP domain-containing sensor histidine kinase [Chthoniobacteraceae bacterium]
MRLRFPLYAKVLFWFLVNLTLVAVLALAFVGGQFRVGMEWLLAGPAEERLEALSERVTADLRDRPVARWGEVLERYRDAQGVTFAIFRNDGRQIAGPLIEPPSALSEKLRDRRGPPNPRPPRPAAASGERGAPAAAAPPRARLAFFLRAGEPAKYWAGIHVGLTHDDPIDPRPVTLLVVADSITGGGLFFDPRPWLTLGCAALLLSALVWLPIVGSITRAIRRVNTAARSIAEGRFDVRVPEVRRDELGELGGSLNAMAAQLGELVERQRRLTADVAHELCSPIARMQRALGVVEQRSMPEQAGYLEKIDRELQHMARLVEEILSFTKAATPPALDAPEDFSCGELVAEVVAREAADARVEVHVPATLRIHAIREAVERALSNVLRNAVRYAGPGGPIEIHAQATDDATEIAIRDHGPGVPAAALGKIFEPFYRPEAARQRTTGGAGLGLAIVKRCVEACGGKVAAALAEPTGLTVTIRLPRGN